MSDLIEELTRIEQGLQAGALTLDALDAATGSARELYERLVVLRHKAREQAAAKPRVAVAPPSAPPVQKPAVAETKINAATPAPPAVQAPVVASAPIRLNTQPAKPAEPAVAAVIEEKEDAPVMRTAAEFLKEALAAKAKAPVSIVEKMEHTRIGDLARAITLSDKFWFTKEIFGGDAKAYEVGVSLLNSAKDLDEARDFLNDELLSKLKAPPDPAALEAFSDLIERRFA